MQTITSHFSFSNTSDKHLLVGNCREIIAAYDSRVEAAADIGCRIPSIDDSPWVSAHIVAPGQTISGDYCQSIPMTASEEAANAAADANLPWMHA